MYHSGKLYFTLHRYQIKVVRKVNDRVVLLCLNANDLLGAFTLVVVVVVVVVLFLHFKPAL